MGLFEIKYKDPETSEWITEIKEFHDFSTPGNMHISAREWAEDYAYSASDKGSYIIQEFKEDVND